MSRVAGFAACLAFSACSFDLTFADPPGPGSVSGRVVLAEPGSTDKRPLGGVEIRILGSGLTTTTTPGGTFTLENVEVTSGLLLVRVDVAGVTRQRVVQLADFGTGPQKKVNLGDIVIGENARVRGKALRGDILPARGGHAGTTVFVPAGPFTAVTNDDGSYAFDQMPEGPVELFIFRTGYEPASLGELRLRSGETVELREVVLGAAVSTVPGTLRGSLTFLPEVSGKGDSAVRLTSAEGTVTATVNDDLTFSATAVPVGLYRVTATRTGYTPLDIINVLVTSGRETNFGQLTLTTAPAFDAGVLPPFDAGVFDAGTFDAGVGDAGQLDAGAPDAGEMDAGLFDAGLPDAGQPDAGFDAGTPVGTPCTQQNDCTQGYWCDVNRCVPLCNVAADCGFGRVCDSLTRTCVQSCVGQCPPGNICNSQNVCQAVCDATFPCPSGKKCSAGQCVPECATTPDCNSPFLTCDLGICKRNGTCVSDLDCPRAEMCFTGQCAGRPTDAGVRPDGGTWTDGGSVFACTQACHCKSGERCFDGYCEPDVLPTRFVARDAGGDGLTAATPTGNLVGTVDGGGVVALLASDTWNMGTATLSLPSNTHLAGGFTVCGANRWVRDTTSRTVVTGSGPASSPNTGTGIVASYGTIGVPRSNVAVSGLRLVTTGIGRCSFPSMPFAYLTGLTLEDIDSELQFGNCPGSGSRSTAIGIERSSNVVARRLRLTGLTVTGTMPVGYIWFNTSGGVLEDISSADLSPLSQEYRGIDIDSPTTATTLRRVSLGKVTTNTGAQAYQVFVRTCAAVPVTVSDVTASWLATQSTNNGAGHVIAVDGCSQLTMQRVRTLTEGHSGVLFNDNAGLVLENSGGTVDDIDLLMPTAGPNVAKTYGLYVLGPRASFVLSRFNVRSSGGTGLDSFGRGVYGLRVESVSQGPLTMRQGAISILGNIAPHGAVVLSSQLGAQLSLTDSTIAVEGTAQCGNDAIGVLLSSSPMRLERNTITAGQASFACGIYLSGTAAEVYGNSIRVGYSNGVTPTCTSNGASDIAGGHAIDVSNISSLRAIGNTFDPGGVTGQVGPTIGVGLNVGSSAVLSSDIILSGRGPDARLLGAANSSSPTFTAANITNNHFSNSYASAVSTREWLFDGGVVLNGGGGAGNTFGGTTTCFAAPGVLPDGGAGFPHFLAPGSACADKGVIGTRTDATAVTLDLFSRPRDGGLGPDIGAVEGP